MILLLYDMVGILSGSLNIAFVVQSFLLSIPLHAPRVAFRRFTTTKFVIWQLIYSQKSAIKLRWNPSHWWAICFDLLKHRRWSTSWHFSKWFWGGQCEKTIVDVKVFNPHAPSNRSTNAKSIYRKHELLSKKHSYEAQSYPWNWTQYLYTFNFFSYRWYMANEATFFTSVLLLYFQTNGIQIMLL